MVSPYAYEWFIQAELAAARGRHDDAALAFENATAAPAHDVVLLTRLAEEYELSGAARRADRALTLARRFFPDSARVAVTEGRIQESRGERRAALASFDRARQLDPKSDEAIIAMARALEARGHSRRACALLLERVEAAGEQGADGALRELTALARRSGDVEMLERALFLDSSSSRASGAREAAQLALDTGRPALAARILRDALSTRDDIELWLRTLVASGDRKEAKRYLTGSMGEPGLTHERRAELLLEIAEPERALELLAPAAPSSEVRYTEARALLARGEYMDAAPILADIPLGTASFEAARLALADCSLSQGRAGAAAETLSVTPHSSLAVRTKLAQIYLEQGDLRAGLRLFDARRASDRSALASIFERAGEFEEAAAYYATIKVSPSADPHVRARSSAEQLAARGQEQAAIAVLKDWASFAPDDLYSRVRLVELLQMGGDSAAAQKLGQEALQLVDQPVLRAHLRKLLALHDRAAN